MTHTGNILFSTFYNLQVSYFIVKLQSNHAAFSFKLVCNLTKSHQKMSPAPKIPQRLKSPSSKSENGRHQFHPYEIQIQQAPGSSLPPHICYETGSETSTANVENELAHLAGLKLVSSKLNQAAQESEKGGSLYLQHQQEQHQNVASMHSWQGKLNL